MSETVEQRRQRAERILSQSNPPLRYHLFGKSPKRVLALDGGGVLGIIEIAFLEKIEALLRQRTNNSRLVLADYFDLIGGTSTGSIIATGLALGMTVAQLKELYINFAAAIFRKPLLSIPVIGPRFDARILANKLRAVLGERQLQSTDLVTGLAVVSKRVDTASPWVLTNHPAAKYWEDEPDDQAVGTMGHIGNKRYKLRDIVRASTAAPYYYSPKRMRIVESEPHGLFVDGGISPHNNPSLQLLMLASIKGYGFHWPVSKDQLMMVSIGCGWIRPRIRVSNPLQLLTLPMAIHTLRGMIWDGQVNTLKIMQWISEPRRPWPINSEVGALEKEGLGFHVDGQQELLKFQRYDVMLDNPRLLSSEIGETVTQADIARINDFMNPEIMNEAYRIAVKCAAVQVDAADFPIGKDDHHSGPEDRPH